MADGGEGTTDALKEAHNAKTYTIQYMTHCIETLKLHMRSQDNQVAIIEMVHHQD